MARIKITGYLDTEAQALDADLVDDNHPSGLTEKGQADLIYDEGGEGLKINDLEDVELDKVG